MKLCTVERINGSDTRSAAETHDKVNTCCIASAERFGCCGTDAYPWVEQLAHCTLRHVLTKVRRAGSTASLKLSLNHGSVVESESNRPCYKLRVGRAADCSERGYTT